MLWIVVKNVRDARNNLQHLESMKAAPKQPGVLAHPKLISTQSYKSPLKTPQDFSDRKNICSGR